MSAILGLNRLGHNKRKFVACRVSADKKYKRSNPQRNRCPRDEPTIPREHRAKGQRAIVERACTRVSDDVHALQRTEMPRLAHARALTHVDTHLSVSLFFFSLSLSRRFSLQLMSFLQDAATLRDACGPIQLPLLTSVYNRTKFLSYIYPSVLSLALQEIVGVIDPILLTTSA